MSKESSRELLKVILKMGGDGVKDEISIEHALQETFDHLAAAATVAASSACCRSRDHMKSPPPLRRCCRDIVHQTQTHTRESRAIPGHGLPGAGGAIPIPKRRASNPSRQRMANHEARGSAGWCKLWLGLPAPPDSQGSHPEARGAQSKSHPIRDPSRQRVAGPEARGPTWFPQKLFVE